MKSFNNLSDEYLKNLGIVDWGYTEDPVALSFNHFKEWVTRGDQGPLSYLSDHRLDKRSDLRKIFPSFQSALVFLFEYHETKKWMMENGQNHVGAFSVGFNGQDYHIVLKDRLTKIIDLLGEKKENYFISLDTQPVLERDLAFRAGLGWIGKNSMLIHRKHGSYFIIGSILLDRKLNLSSPTVEHDHCGTCLACVIECPTSAIDPITRTLRAKECLSTFTVEIFKPLDPPKGIEKSRGEIFGCDICQDVCPWNKKNLLAQTGKLIIESSFIYMKDWFFEWPRQKLIDFLKSMTNRGYRKRVQGSSLERLGRVGLLKNLEATSSQNDFLKMHKDEE